MGSEEQWACETPGRRAMWICSASALLHLLGYWLVHVGALETASGVVVDLVRTCSDDVVVAVSMPRSLPENIL
jgi:hypothetical protein